MKKSPIIISLIIILLLIFLISFLFLFKSPAGISGPSDNTVVEVIDGDTFRLWNRETVRMICIDAPEKGSPDYEISKDFLSFLILNKEVRLEKDISDKDQYGRLLRYVYVKDSNDYEVFVNKMLVNQGYASLFPYGNDTRLCDEISRNSS